MNLRAWLRRVPQPVTVRLDRKKTLRISEGKNKWRDVLDAIELEQPSVLEALDAEGLTIRITQLADPDDKREEPEDEKPKTELAALGKLLLDAYRAGADQHARAYELAFAENTKLVSILAERLGGLERAYQATIDRRADEVARAVGEGGDSLSSLLDGPLAPLLSGFLAKQLETKKPPPPAASAEANGKKGK